MSSRTIATRKVRATWYHWNYFRVKGEPHWEQPDPPEVLEARETKKSYIVRYGQGNVRKILKKFYRHRGGERKHWHEYYGSHERLTCTKIVFEIIPPDGPAESPVVQSS